MAPRAPTLLSLMSSTSYPPLPGTEDLEQLHQALAAQASAVTARLAASVATAQSGHEEERRGKKNKRDREQTEDRERAALAANERAGLALEAVERRRMDPADVKVKRERVSPAPSNASSASFRPNSSQTTYGGMLNKKKKPKRVLDSDDEGSAAHPTPPPHSASTSGLKLKLPPGGHQKSRAQSHADPSPTPSSATAGPLTGIGSSIDWSVPPPPSRPLIPVRTGVQKPLKPGPKRQSEVDEDYSDKKAPSQIAIQTFWQNVEPYIRDIREDDLAMLNFKADTPDSYVIPNRGRHYTEIWDEEDGNPPGTTSRFPVPSMRQGDAPPPLTHFVASEVRDINLIEENRGLGPMTERIVAAVIGGRDVGEINKEEAARRPEPMDDVQRDAARVDVVDLEDRVKKELRSVMLLGEHEEFEPVNREDDEVTSSLRQCQRLLSKQSTLNDARKAHLAEIARQRLAYSEYTNVLDDIEKQIEASWAKRVKKHGSSGKQTIQNGIISGNGRPPVQESLKTKVELRRRWMDTVGRTMRERPTGAVMGLPTKSIYEGIGEGSEKDEMEEDDMDADEVDSTAV